MSQLQYRIWKDKIREIDDFIVGRRDFDSLASNLEPPLDAAPIKDQAFLQEWYRLWEPLEVKNAIDLDKGIVTKYNDVKDQVDEIKKFFKRNLERVERLKE